MNGMFRSCENLQFLDLSNFNTCNMFYRCKLLIDLDISKFDFKNVKTMKGMFLGCSDELKLEVRKQNKGLKEEAF